MATVEKRGKSYRIRASNGYTVGGKQVRPSITWEPPEGMSEKKAKKEAEAMGVRLEDQIKRGVFRDSRIKFSDFKDIFLRDSNLKPKTLWDYKEKLERIDAALGHIRLCDLTPTHINMFYNNLKEVDIRESCSAVCKKDIDAYLKKKHITRMEFAAAADISRSTLKCAIDEKRVSGQTAQKIAAAMGEKTSSIFSLESAAEPLAPSTISAYHRVLSAILGKAVKWGYLESNPAQRAEKPVSGRHEAKYLEEDEARRLLELLQDEPIKWRSIVTFDLLSGLRRAEFLGLRWQDVDIDNQMLFIRQTWNYVPGVGCYVGTPKSEDSIRPLKVTPTAILMLLQYQRWQDTQRERCGDAWEDKDGRVFTSDTGAPIFPDSISKWFSQFVKRTGLPDVTIHSLRHTYASLMISDETPVVVVSRQLGHAQTSTTNNIYAHMIASARTKALKVFDRFEDLVVPEGTDKDQKKAAGG